MTWEDSDSAELDTELTALGDFVNECDTKIRTAAPLVKGMRSVLANVGLDGGEIPDDDRETMKTNLIAKSKKARGVT